MKFEEGWSSLSVQRNDQSQTGNTMKLSISPEHTKYFERLKRFEAHEDWFGWDVPGLSTPKWVQPWWGTAWPTVLRT